MNGDSDAAPGLDALLQHAPTGTQERELKCCCGSPECAFLKHNTVALEGLEKDLLSAAQIGQALLVRHETHMVEAEHERIRMQATMDRLENDKKELEAANAKTIEENRDLLDQLEGLNNLVSESDTQIEALAATLQSTQQELQRLSILAGRAETLEQQLTDLEVEQEELQTRLNSSKEESRSAIQRWKRAEGTIGHLQEQIDRIEKEAKEERERHVEVLRRLERRRTVEKELENAAGRLKGAAALNNISKYNGDGRVVSHFVKDILQDNANLQSGIVELREMLMGSNAEVENLRQQLELHQPLEEDNQQTLRMELSQAEPEIEQPAPEVIPELHVHHHYHGPEVTVKKPRKKRPAITTNHFLGSGALTPRQRVKDWSSSTPTSAATILSQTSATVPPVRPQGHHHRWSTQSTNSFAPSSVPSSPHRASSIFDNFENAFDSSRPTTPESSVPGSPVDGSKDGKLFRKPAFRSVSTPTHIQISAIEESAEHSTFKAGSEEKIDEFDDPNFSDSSYIKPTHWRPNFNIEEQTISGGSEPIPEEVETDETTPTPSTPSYLDDMSPHPLRRTNSHDSLLSVSGMDIHTLRSRPSQLLVSGMGFSPRSSLSPASAALKSTQPVFSPETAMARPTLTRAIDSRALLAQQRYGSSLNPASSSSGVRPTITKRVGGWVWSKWGVSPTPSSENLRCKVNEDSLESIMRGTGVNQMGMIKGLTPPPRAPIQVVPDKVDGDALGEALSEVR